MRDRPSWDEPDQRWRFETCAVCKKGKDKGALYGCLEWGFDVDGDNRLTSSSVKANDFGSQGFWGAVDQWNKEARGPKEERQHPDQEPLPPLYIPEPPPEFFENPSEVGR
jgi:hypothetical protein